MLPIKLERVIFIIIYIACFVTCFIITSQIKANDLPINKGLTPEQVIEDEFKGQSVNLKYEYKIYDNIMFVCYEERAGYDTIGFAFKNPYSGFMFGVPGLFPSTMWRNERDGYIDVGDQDELNYIVGKVYSKYYVAIYDYSGQRNIDFYIDEKKMDVMEIGNDKSKYWVGVIDDLSNYKELKGSYNGEIINVMDAKKIKTLFGE